MAAEGLEFRMLGPLEVTSDGDPVALGGPKPRAVVSVLLCRVNRTVSTDVLVEALWADDPPPSAPNTLQGYVSNLRRALEPDRPPRRPSAVLPASGAGYSLRVDPDRVDALRFERLAGNAREALAGHDPVRAMNLLDAALGLWRSDALDEVVDAIGRAETARLEQLRLLAIEDRFEAGLLLGQHTQLVGDLQRLVLVDPMRERVWGQLMLALYRAGRQGEALRTYQRARRVLGEELGIEPCQALQRLEAAVLAHDASLDLDTGAGGLAARGAAVPARSAGQAGQDGTADPFVGRQAELIDLCGLWEEARRGRGRVVLVTGEAGIGKTTLVREFAAVAVRQGGSVATGRCWQGDGAPAFWCWTQVVRSWAASRTVEEIGEAVGRGGGYLARAFPDLAGLLDGDQPTTPVDAGYGRFALFDAVAGLLRRTALRAPMVVVLDDLHAADGLSLRLLEFVCNGIDDLPLLIVACAREGEPGPNPDLAAALAVLSRSHGCRRIRLRGFTPEEVSGLVEATSSRHPSPAVVAELHRMTAGNPFFAREMVRVLDAEGGLRPAGSSPGGGLPIPAAVRDVVRQRFAELSPAAERALVVAAVIGDEFSFDVLEELADVKGESLLDVLDEAVRALVVREVPGAVGRYAFCHALFRETLEGDLTESRRAFVHRRVAEAIEVVGAADLDRHLAALAHHLLLGATPHDTHRAVDVALRAARNCAEQFAYEDAVVLLARARDLLGRAPTASGHRLAAVLLAVGDAHNRLGDVDAARQAHVAAADAARRAGADEELGLAAAGYPAVVRPASDAGRLGLALLEEALEALGRTDGRARALVLSRLVRWRHLDGRHEEGKVLATAAVDMAGRLGDPDLLAAVLNNLYWGLYGPDHPRDRLAVASRLLALAESTGDLELAAQGHEWRLRDLLELGEVEQAEEAALLLRRAARSTSSARYLWYVATHQVMTACVEGRFDEAEKLAFAALGLGRHLTSRHPTRRRATRLDRPAELTFDLQLFTLRWFQGRAGELAPTFEPVLEDDRTNDAWLCGMALVYCESGREEEARPLYEKVRAGGFSAVRRNGEWLAKMTSLAHVSAMLGDAGGAAELYRLLLPYESRNCVINEFAFFGSVSHALGRLAVTMARYDHAERHFMAAVERHRRMKSPPWVAVAEHGLARALVERGAPGDWERAEGLVGRAVVTAERLGIFVLAGQLRAIQAYMASRPPLSGHAGRSHPGYGGRPAGPGKSAGVPVPASGGRPA